jgi:hypothetical protein
MKNVIAALFILILLCFPIEAQTYNFFNDSPTNTSYDWSFGFYKAPSTVQIIGQKFPVDTVYRHSGTNSLKLSWSSKSGGKWGLAVAEVGTPWPTHDVTKVDSLIFWAYSLSPIDSMKLPLLYLEDNNNLHTPTIQLSAYAPSIKANIWTKISVPLKVFVSGPSNVNLTIIKTIYFGQDAADDSVHTLYLDDIKMLTAASASDTTFPATPASVIAKGYDMHINVSWTPNKETDLAGYKVYRSDNNIMKLLGTVSPDEHIFTDFVGSEGVNKTYKVSAFDQSQNESPMSASVSASTIAMNDSLLLDMVEEAAFRYFWDYGHPVSGLARERTNSGNTVTTGGSGFGIMSLLAGIQRGFITRDQGTQRIIQILSFLATKADRFHGAFPHWMDGETGKVIPFSQYDDGGDLVETAYLMQGLLAARQFFNLNNTNEYIIRTFVTQLWQDVEWNWYRQDSTGNFLYWHWSPDYGFKINFALTGPNETMITYLLAIASPTHPVPARLYYDGWAGSSSYTNGKSFYGYKIFVGWDYGGPLFFTHYSFLGFDPRNKKDKFANYFVNNRNITLINREYCITNPKGYAGYDANTWGLTASDDPLVGYLAHEPTSQHDNGTIAPTAALSAMPYTPTESIAAFKNLYTKYGSKLWGPFGFGDAFNVQQNWYDNTYLAIDEGPIAAMIENYRSQLIWNNFMANPEIETMLNSIGFVDDITAVQKKDKVPKEFILEGNYPNPFNPSTTIKFQLPHSQNISLVIFNTLGQVVKHLTNGILPAGENMITWNSTNDSSIVVPSGVYIYSLSVEGKVYNRKMLLLK